MGDCASSEERKVEPNARPPPKQTAASSDGSFPVAPKVAASGPEAETKSRAIDRASDKEVGRVARPVKDNSRKSVAELEFVDGKVPLPTPKRLTLTPRPSVSLAASEPAAAEGAGQFAPRRESRVSSSRTSLSARATAAPITVAADGAAAEREEPDAPHRFAGLQGLAEKRNGNREDYTLDDLDLEMCEEFWEECRRKCGSLKNAFNQLDVELNARIKRREFKTVGDPDHLNCTWLQEHNMHIFWLLDSNEDGIMRYEEFNGERSKLAMPESPDAN